MLKRLTTGLVAAMLLAGLAAAAPLEGEATYDLLFRNGTLDDIDRDSELVYERRVTNALKPDAEGRDTGSIALSFGDDEESDDMAVLEFRRDGKHRALGRFPASVGNPMIMYFYETVVRDMAEAAGGSPFYIRNRVKDALIETSEIEEGEATVDGRTIPVRTIRLYPFRDDPNIDRMQGWGDLELSVTMSDEVPGWYVRFVAEASDGEVYQSEVTFDRLDDTP